MNVHGCMYLCILTEQIVPGLDRKLKKKAVNYNGFMKGEKKMEILVGKGL